MRSGTLIASTSSAQKCWPYGDSPGLRGVKMNAKKTAFLVVILAALAGVISFVIWFSNHGFSAREKPSWIETVLARRARRIATPAGAKEMKNSHPVTEASMAE